MPPHIFWIQSCVCRIGLFDDYLNSAAKWQFDKTFFLSSLTAILNKLDCLSLKDCYSSRIFVSKPGAFQSGAAYHAPLSDKACILTHKYLASLKNFARSKHPSLSTTTIKKFYSIDTQTYYSYLCLHSLPTWGQSYKTVCGRNLRIFVLS